MVKTGNIVSALLAVFLLVGSLQADSTFVRKSGDPFTGQIRTEGEVLPVRARDFSHLGSATADSNSKGQSPKSVSRGDGFRRSLLLPGWGQMSAGNDTKGYIFLGVEVALIGGLIGSYFYSKWTEEEYQSFARQYGGVTGKHPHQFYVDAGNWTDNRSYNDKRLQERDFEALYTHPNDSWFWESDSRRREFKSMRIASDLAGQLIVFMAGGIVINHIASAIDAARNPSDAPRVTLLPSATPEESRVTLSVRF